MNVPPNGEFDLVVWALGVPSPQTDLGSKSPGHRSKPPTKGKLKLYSIPNVQGLRKKLTQQGNLLWRSLALQGLVQKSQSSFWNHAGVPPPPPPPPCAVWQVYILFGVRSVAGSRIIWPAGAQSPARRNVAGVLIISPGRQSIKT